MTSEIPEIFKTLLEYPFSLQSLDDSGKNLSNNIYPLCMLL